MTKTITGFFNGQNVYAPEKKEDPNKSGYQQVQNKVVDFFEENIRQLKEDPIQFEMYNLAVTNGIDEAYDLQKQYQDFTHPEHEKAHATFRSKSYDLVAVAKACIANRILKTGAKKLEMRETGYENKILSALQPSTTDDIWAIEKLRNDFKLGWSKWGYSKDMATFKDFVSKNRLTTADACEQRIANIIGDHGERIDAKIKDSAPTAASNRMKQLNAEIAEDNAKRDVARK